MHNHVIRQLVFACLCCSILYGQRSPQNDWLVSLALQTAQIRENKPEKTLTLSNGLVQRVFCLAPNLTTISMRWVDGAEFIRGVKPEAIISLDAKSFAIGGLKGQPDYAFLQPDWLQKMSNDDDAFQFSGYAIDKVRAPFQFRNKKMKEYQKNRCI